MVELLNSYARYDICWWACPNGDYRSPKVGARLKRQGVRPGAADLMLMIDHIFYGLELKTETGTLSKNQRLFQQDLVRAGGVYYVAYGLDQAIQVLKNIEAFRPNVRINSREVRVSA